MTITEQFKAALADNLAKAGKQPEHATAAALPWDDATKAAVAKTTNDYGNLVASRANVAKILGVNRNTIGGCFNPRDGR
jgi:hypothetical protein